tara:strand:+ start:3822 stop:4322 length:501 start_codon:yes stop_codon:yes gene_type:complete
MKPIVLNTDIDIDLVINDILQIPESIKSNSNIYDVIFNCNSFSNILDKVIQTLSISTGEKFTTYVKNIQGYIQTDELSTPIVFDKMLKRRISSTPKYSFIFIASQTKTRLYFKTVSSTKNIEVSNGDLVIFKTSDFIKDEYDKSNRIALLGSITNDINFKGTSNLI